MIRNIGPLNLNDAKQKQRQKLSLKLLNDQKIDILSVQELDTNTNDALQQEIMECP